MNKLTIKIALADHVTAKCLREAGVKVPDDIPDDWHVPRAALVFGEGIETEIKGDVLNVKMPLWINAPFSAPPTIELELDKPPKCTACGTDIEPYAAFTANRKPGLYCEECYDKEGK